MSHIELAYDSPQKAESQTISANSSSADTAETVIIEPTVDGEFNAANKYACVLEKRPAQIPPIVA